MGEQLLIRRFSEFGKVLTAALRYRPPETDTPNNSWALLTFASLSSVEDMMQAQRTFQVRVDIIGHARIR